MVTIDNRAGSSNLLSRVCWLCDNVCVDYCENFRGIYLSLFLEDRSGALRMLFRYLETKGVKVDVITNNEYLPIIVKDAVTVKHVMCD